MAVELNYQELVNRFVEQNGHVPEIQFIIVEPHAVEITGIEGGGIMNYIIRVQSKDGLHSIILKYGVGHARCNPEIKFSLERQAREYHALQLMNWKIPGSAPKPYSYDCKNHIICMEDMRDMELLGDQLVRGEINLETTSNIGKILAQMHKATSKKELTQQEWQQLEALFSDRADIEMIFDNLSRKIFQENSPLVSLPESVLPVFRKCASILLSKHIDKKLKEKLDLQECFIHGDCHWMSVFINKDRIAFGHLGNPDHHLAWMAISYYISMLEAITKCPSRTREIKDRSEMAFRTLVVSYYKWKEMSCSGDLGESRNDVNLSTFVLFCGAIMFFFAVLVGGDLLISLRDEQKSHLISLGTRLMLTDGDNKQLDDVTRLLFHSH